MRIKMRKLIPVTIILCLLLYSKISHGQCVADYDFDDSSLVVPFENQSLHIESDPIISFEWNFGDNTNSDNESPQHIYASAGAYLTSLAIETESGCRDTISKNIYICDFNLDYDLQVGCDEDNKVSLDLFITDTYSNAGPFNVFIDGLLLNPDPIVTINDTVSLFTELLADGLEHIITINSLEHVNCSIEEIITLTACVPPCNLSNLNAQITNSDTIIAEVNSNGYNPEALNVTTGSNILFKWNTNDRSVTSISNTNGQDWDSGLLNTGDEYLLYSYAPGIFSFTSSNNPNGFNPGSLVSTCPDTAFYNLLLSFENCGQSGSYNLWIDGVPTAYSQIPYSTDGFDTIYITMPGDGVLHTYRVIDNASSSCNLSTAIQAPLCSVASDCNLYLEATQSTPCNQDSLVDVVFTILSAGGSDNGFNLYIDDVLFESGIAYEGTETLITRSLLGDGEEHIITIQDIENDTCQASTSILLEDCAQPCLIINPFAGVGSNNNIVVNVFDDTFSPKDITISAGDKIIWQWQTDTLRSVTAFDFLFDSGVEGPGASFTSPILPIGVHRYFSEFNGMEGSITVEPNCENSLIPIVYSFNKFGGANTGYNVLVDDIKINPSPISYQPNGNNLGNSFVEGDGATHTVTIIDAVDTTCTAFQSFQVPFCDESTCDIFIENVTLGECEDNNTVIFHADILSFNTNDSLIWVSVDGAISDTISLDSSGTTAIDVLLAGDGLSHTLIVSDLLESSCADTITFDTPLCDAPCNFSPITIGYIEESPTDSCFDGSAQLTISTEAIQNFQSEYILSISTSTNVDIIDTLSYPLDGNIFQSIDLIADGSILDISITDSEDNSCKVDTNFALYQCDPDPCQLSLIDLQYGDCMNGGIMDITVTIDTFRVSDSLSVEIDESEVFIGTFEEFFDDPTFQITYTGEQRTIRVFDLKNSSCRLSENFFTPVCPIDCIITADYTLLDSCITVLDSNYSILLSTTVLNADSDSVLIEIVGSGINFNAAYSDLVVGIPLEIPVADDNPTIGIFDSQNDQCRDFISIEPPTCVLDCEIEITNINLVDSTCINGERQIEILVNYELPTSDSLRLFIDGILIDEFPYPMDSLITTTIVGDGTNHQFIIVDLQNEACADTLNTIIEECEFDCEDFIADFSFTIDTITQTVNFNDLTLGGSDSWLWNFGDGTLSSDANPFHTYSMIGEYTVCLTVENTIENCIQEICKEIDLVDIDCEASFDYVTDGLMVSFSNTSTSLSPINSRRWLINGETELLEIENGSFTAENSSTFEICLTIETESGCMDTHCEIVELIKPCNLNPAFDFHIDLDTIQLINISEGEYTSISWTLGDGTTLNGEEVDHIYQADGEYTVCMTISDVEAEDCSFTICKEINIVTCDINAVFLINIDQDTLNVELINDLGDNDISWNFGNGFGATINPVEYIYTEQGDFTVCATITDPSIENCTVVHCEDISIIISNTDALSISELDVYPNPIRKGDIITIKNLDQIDLTIKIYNITGEAVLAKFKKEQNNYSLFTDHLASGHYLIKLNSAAQSVTKKVIIID